ncbi:MAG: cobalamin-binding protein [Treponema sp.]|nr:cobalamin-binding protein [Treponema sp.]
MRNKFTTLCALILAFCVICGGLSGCAKKSNVAASGIPQKIICLSPAGTEILFAIGAQEQVIAVSEFSDYPPEALEKPVIGGFDGKSISLEKILAMQPDFVYLTDGMHNFMIPQLETYNIRYYLSNASSIAAIKKEITELGEITGHTKEAAKVVEEMTLAEEEARANSTSENSSPRVYYEVWANPYMTAGTSSFINDIITAAGGSNIFSDLTENYPLISEETIIARNPEFIFIPITSGITKKQVAARNGWSQIDAVKNGRIILIDDNVYTRSGPRVANCIKEMSEIFAK